MNVYCNGTAGIKHHAIGKIYEIENDELNWDALGGDERQMGPEIHYEAVFDHPELGPADLRPLGISGRYRELL